jgi:hypothetical protein
MVRFWHVPAFAATISLLSATAARAQTDIPRIEAGIHFTEFRLRAPIAEGAAGIGARFGWNLSNHLGFEGEVNHFPGSTGPRGTPDFHETEGLFGAKVGFGTKYGGIFGKVRPGFLHFPKDSAAAQRGLMRQDYFALDLGVVAERYFANHAYLRLDAGDTIVSYRNESFLDAFGSTTRLGTSHNFQLSLGVGVHF